jgi:uncharacterized phage protein gp47/JayE
LSDIQTAIETAERANIDPALDVSSDQPLGQLNGIVASVAADVCAALQATYESIDPNAAEGVGLDNVSSITGTFRPEARATVVSCSVGTFNATIPAGSLASVVGHADQIFALKNTITTTSGTVTVLADFVCTVDGPIDVQPGTLTNIVTPIAGWLSITNPAAGTLGANADTDAQLRLLRQQEIAQSGSCAQDALRARILEISGVLSARVYTNDSDTAVSTTTSNTTTTSITRPPHSFEVVLWDGPSPAASTTSILQTIWDNKPTGGVSVGTSSGTVTDALGATQTVYFSRAVGKRLYVRVTVTKGDNYVGDSAAAAALSDYITSTQIDPGTAVIARKLSAVVTDLDGVDDITVLQFDFTASPTNTANLITAYDAVATLADVDVTVTS